MNKIALSGMKYINRSLMRGPFVALCLSETAFRRELALFKVKPHEQPEFCYHGANATTHYLEYKKEKVAIVCLTLWLGAKPLEIAGLLVHEATHIWQKHCAWIHEDEPGHEAEAYGIQLIAQGLMGAYADTLRRRRK